MSDLSKPADALDWASSWLREEAMGHMALVRRNPGSARRRIEEAIAELAREPVQAKRCADGIAALRAFVAAL